MLNVLLSVLVYLFLFDPIGCFSPVILPEGIRLTRVNESESKWLANICGVSTENVNSRGNGTLKGRRYPWAISVMHFGRNKLGGAIISPYHILTAGHGFVKFQTYENTDYDTASCTVKGFRSNEELRIRVVAYGGDCIRGKSKALTNNPACEHSTVIYNRIKAVLIDNDFGKYYCIDGHDWAIIEVAEPIQFNENVQPICLPGPSQRIDLELMVVGWGRYSFFDRSNPLIHEIPMRYDKKCRAPYSDNMPTNVDDYLCATSMNPMDYAAARTCHGDSGAGIEQRDPNQRATLMGITSFGTKGCPANEVARFTKVSSYLKEICEYTGVCYTIIKK